ncbi:MAG: hypothetical protein ACYC0X_12275 [Pirellulaceae bacterium]
MKDKYPPICPTTITPAIRQFAHELGGASEPEYVEVHPQPFAENARCYDNCFLAQQLFGGEPVLGFIIWSTSDVMLTAEHHCVLRQVDGRLIDVTPDPIAVKRILFVATNQLVTVENIEEIVVNGTTGGYKVLVDHPLLQRAANTLQQAAEKYHRRQLEAAASGTVPSAADLDQWNLAVVEMERLIEGYYAYQQLADRNQLRKLRTWKQKLERTRKKKARTRT